MNNENQTDAITLRKLRELKRINRKEAGILLGTGFKAVEKFENGRTALSRTKIDKILLSYGFNYSDFQLCREGKSEQVKLKLGHKIKKVHDDNNTRRSYKRIITKEAEDLQVLRKLKSLTQYQASYHCGYSKTAIGHIENGRIEIPHSRIKHIVESYGFTMKDFEYHMKSEKLVTDIQDDCITIIKGLSEEKLKVVFPLLSTFKN